jgi:hypothetical protein
MGLTMLGVVLTVMLAGNSAVAARGLPSVPNETPSARPSVAEPLNRDEVIAQLRQEYQQAVAEVRRQELAWYEEQPKPSLVYQDRFDATLRHVDGFDVDQPLWEQSRYPGEGEAATGLNALAVELRALPALEEELEEGLRLLGDLEARYDEAQRQLARAEARARITNEPVPPSFLQEVENLAQLIANQQSLVADLQSQVIGLRNELGAWDRQEARYRALDQQHVTGLQAQARTRVRQRTRQLGGEPGFAFILAYDRLVKSVERADGVLQLLQATVARAEDEDRARELSTKVEAQRALLEGRQAELAALVEAYFAARAETLVPADTPALANP